MEVRTSHSSTISPVADHMPPQRPSPVLCPGEHRPFPGANCQLPYLHADSLLASDPDWILIATWNEWWETTHIEPSQAFGDLYLGLTREYAVRWKGG